MYPGPDQPSGYHRAVEHRRLRLIVLRPFDDRNERVRRIGGGTQTGEAFDDMPIGALPASTNKTMRFTGTSVLKVVDGLIVEEIGLDDGVTVLQQLDLIKPA